MATRFITPEIEAQRLCLTALGSLANSLYNVYRMLKHKGLVTEFNHETKLYNSGYEVRFKAVIDWDAVKKEENAKMVEKFDKILSGSSVSIQPSPYFSEDIKHGSAKIQCQLPVFGCEGIGIQYLEESSVSDSSHAQMEKVINSVVDRFDSIVDEVIESVGK